MSEKLKNIIGSIITIILFLGFLGIIFLFAYNLGQPEVIRQKACNNLTHPFKSTVVPVMDDNYNCCYSFVVNTDKGFEKHKTCIALIGGN